MKSKYSITQTQDKSGILSTRLTLFMASSAFLIGLISVLPAMADICSDSDNLSIGCVWDDFTKQTGSIWQLTEAQINNILNNSTRMESDEFIGAYEEGTLPDPINARNNTSALDEQTNLQNDPFEANSIIRGDLVSNELDRLMTRGSIDGVFGQQGQEQTLALLDGTQANVEEIDFAHNRANETANRVKENIAYGTISAYEGAAGRGTSFMPTNERIGYLISLQSDQSKMIGDLSELQVDLIETQSRQAQISGQLLSGNTQLRHDLQYTNLNLTNISEQMDEGNRIKRVETAASGAQLFRVGSQVNGFLVPLDSDSSEDTDN